MGRWGKVLVLGASLSLLQACTDTTGPEEPGDGLRLTWEDGAVSRSRGTPSLEEGGALKGEFAVAFPDSLGGLVLAAFRPREGQRGDLFILQLKTRRAGALGPCVPSGECHGRYLEGLDPGDLAVRFDRWEITGGRVEVRGDGPDRFRGGFEDLLLTGPNDGESLRRIGRGSFDVPLLDAEEGARALACFLARLEGRGCP